MLNSPRSSSNKLPPRQALSAFPTTKRTVGLAGFAAIFAATLSLQAFQTVTWGPSDHNGTTIITEIGPQIASWGVTYQVPNAAPFFNGQPLVAVNMSWTMDIYVDYSFDSTDQQTQVEVQFAAGGGTGDVPFGPPGVPINDGTNPPSTLDLSVVLGTNIELSWLFGLYGPDTISFDPTVDPIVSGTLNDPDGPRVGTTSWGDYTLAGAGAIPSEFSDGTPLTFLGFFSADTFFEVLAGNTVETISPFGTGSVSVSYVYLPEPGTWGAMLVGGILATSVALRRRASRVSENA